MTCTAEDIGYLTVLSFPRSCRDEHRGPARSFCILGADTVPGPSSALDTLTKPDVISWDWKCLHGRSQWVLPGHTRIKVWCSESSLELQSNYFYNYYCTPFVLLQKPYKRGFPSPTRLSMPSLPTPISLLGDLGLPQL